jgi:hypothetical protein
VLTNRIALRDVESVIHCSAGPSSGNILGRFSLFTLLSLHGEARNIYKMMIILLFDSLIYTISYNRSTDSTILKLSDINLIVCTLILWNE